MQCSMCGKKEAILKTEVEGTVMQVCEECSKFGKVLSSIKKEPSKKELKLHFQAKPISISQDISAEPIKLIVDNYSELIKNAREKKGLKQEDFAKQINEKASLIHLFESKRKEPSISVAQKLEKALGIKLIELYEEKGIGNKQIGSKTPNEITAENLVTIKYRKKN